MRSESNCLFLVCWKTLNSSLFHKIMIIISFLLFWSNIGIHFIRRYITSASCVHVLRLLYWSPATKLHFHHTHNKQKTHNLLMVDCSNTKKKSNSITLDCVVIIIMIIVVVVFVLLLALLFFHRQFMGLLRQY